MFSDSDSDDIDDSDPIFETKPGRGTNVASAVPSVFLADAITAAEHALDGTFNGHPPTLEFLALEDGSLTSHTLSRLRMRQMPGRRLSLTAELLSGTDFVTKASYLVLPIQEILTQGFQTIVDPQDPLASTPNGWQSDGTTNTTTMVGNNAISFKGAQTATTTESVAGLISNYPQNAGTAPTTTADVDGARVNAFYIVNTLVVGGFGPEIGPNLNRTEPNATFRFKLISLIKADIVFGFLFLHFPSYIMEEVASTLGCAQNADGSLRNASELPWFNDADDERPISGPSSSGASTATIPVYPLFTKNVRPLDKVAGVRRSSPTRRSSRHSKPSARASDPNNAEATSSISKRKASPAARQPAKKAQVKRVESSDGESDMESLGGSGDSSADEDGDAESPTAMDVDEEYQKFKAMGDADHAHATTKSARIDSTADVRTIFKRVDCEKNPDTGAIVRKAGAICLVCTKKGLKADVCFLTGSVSTLRSHIARHDDHFQTYRARCEKLDIPMHPRAIPESDSSGSKEVQGTLDGIVATKPRPPVFTSEGLRDFLIEMIVTQDEALSIVERPSFRRLLQYCRPSITETDIPTRRTIRKYVLQLAKDVQAKLFDEFQKPSGLHSLSHDAWTSDSGIPFLNINNHYIRSPPDHPNDWEIVTDELGFVKIEGRHTGENIGAAILTSLDKYGLREKVGWVTADGASVNRTTAKALERRLDNSDAEWTAKERDMIAARANGELDADEVAKILASFGEEEEDEENGEGSEWTAGDAIGKILALIKQIRMSPQARAFFKKCCIQSDVPVLELLLWVRTRWASLYKCLDRCLTLRKAIDLFVRIADDSDEVPDLRNKQYNNYTLTKKEWAKIEMIHEALREPADVTQSFSSERTPTVWRIIPTLEFLIKRWETMSTQPKFAEIEDALKEGVKSLKKWFHRTETTSGAYFICLVLNPAVKDVYFRAHWDADDYEAGIAAMEEAFDKYSAMNPETKETQTSSVPVQAKPASLRRYGSSFLMDVVNSVQQAERARAHPRDELKGYLSSPLENTDNVLHYWGHNTAYPTLRRMARDYLAIQGSATPAERAFSSGSLTGTKLRNSLSAELFEALQLLKSAYRNGHISASAIASTHIDALIEELEADFGFSADIDADSEDDDFVV
ncbi:hypothetical protein MSAN_02401300 [Mycena sanguinolenta]|uniref:HAT C-terminal dimerisation domain-containing protein n=1 Tax=Mycena sanguinolenta TaxID=230812 RepID=A0A8H6X3Q0_9AGAR|nr:hypothetical protein MSAN_02401300 [Mycena sanguinolenta]